MAKLDIERLSLRDFFCILKLEQLKSCSVKEMDPYKRNMLSI